MSARELGNPLGNPLARPRSAGGSTRGEVLFTFPGTYSWICPPGVTSVCAVAVGPGGPNRNGSGNTTDCWGGGGGALGWANGIPVTPGQTYSITVGATGYTVNTSGSFVAATNTTGLGLTAQAGLATYTTAAAFSFTGSATSTGGGNGGVGGRTTNGQNIPGGGGAGGYSGNGSAGVSGGASSAASGGGGSGGSNRSGGGVGIYGEGTSGAGAPSDNNPGKGGSGGSDGDTNLTANGLLFSSSFGGGSGASSFAIYNPGPGAFRILWGAGRAFPSTDVGPS